MTTGDQNKYGFCNDCAKPLYIGNCSLCKKEYSIGDYSNVKDCEKCELTVCMDCVAITGCQTVSCICKSCFDYKCKNCFADIQKDKVYLWDYELEDQDLCEKCIKIE